MRKVEANRRNALQSTGPRTPRGKAYGRRNALKHGLFVWDPYRGTHISSRWVFFKGACLDSQFRCFGEAVLSTERGEIRRAW